MVLILVLLVIDGGIGFNFAICIDFGIGFDFSIGFDFGIGIDSCMIIDFGIGYGFAIGFDFSIGVDFDIGNNFVIGIDFVIGFGEQRNLSDNSRSLFPSQFEMAQSEGAHCEICLHLVGKCNKSESGHES